VSIDTDALKARRDIVEVVGSYIGLRKRGAEYLGLCPFHPDKNPSLYVIPKKQFAYCHSCGASHDVISFVREIESIDFKAACEKLGATDSWAPVAAIPHEPAAVVPERITSKPPADAKPPKFQLRTLGDPVLTFEIRDLAGDLLGYECRYEKDGKKEPRVWTWGQRGDQPAGWGVGHFNAPRPLYGLPRVAAQPEATVAIFEGPKKADSASRLLSSYACISWTGGAHAWKKHDWSPIAGRKVLLFPDADAPGWEACDALAAILADPRGLACQVRIVDTHGMPEGWDVADAEAEGWDTAKLIEWAKPRASDFKRPESPPAVVPEPVSVPAVVPAPDSSPDAPKPAKTPRKPSGGRPRLAAVDGNTALSPDEDEEPLPQAMSEDALAQAFADEHAGAWRYVKVWNQWFQWRGDGWYRDDIARIDRLAVELTRQAIYWPEAQQLTPDGKRKVNSRRTAGAVRDIAQSDPRIAATVDQWDTDPWLLGVPGGMVDLRTGALKPADPMAYITKRTAVAPMPGPAPIWQQFLETVTEGNEELISFLQRFAGYALTGESREQCLAFLYGTGQNGKGVFISTLARVLGDYAVAADADVFMESDQQRHPTEMARLRGARLVTVDETDSSKRWNEKRIKRITGGGKIEARFMGKDHFEYLPQFKLLIAGNHKPQLRGVGKAIQRRIRMIPFVVTIPDDRRDDQLVEKLAAEYPQILQWALDGCAAWAAGGLAAPPEVVEATASYIEGEDIIGEWIEERTEQRGEVERPVAYSNYRAWCDKRGERAWSSKAFWAALEERGFKLRRSNAGRYIIGLSMISTGEEPPAAYWEQS
jgi:putative DNA primase/helicase